MDFKTRLSNVIRGHLLDLSVACSQDDILALISRKIVFLDNPSVFKNVGLIHEHMGGAKQSTTRLQNAMQQFNVSVNAVKVGFLGNYH